MYNVYIKYVLEAKKKKDASASKGDLLKCHNYFLHSLLQQVTRWGSLSSDKSL